MKVNEYFNGNVTSISFQGKDSPATAGVIAPGEYEFSTQQKEIMTITSGEMDAKLQGELEFKTYSSYQSFTVPAGEKFKVIAKNDVSYICLYY